MARFRLLDSLRRLFGGLRPARAQRKAARAEPQVVTGRGAPGQLPSGRGGLTAAAGASVQGAVRPQEPLAAKAPVTSAAKPQAESQAAPQATSQGVSPSPAFTAPAAPMASSAAAAAATAPPIAAAAPVPAAAPAPTFAPAPAPAKTMRSLEEVRADLARLRESARERHAQLQVRREASAFAPTDFMDFAKVPEPAPSEPVPLLPPRQSGEEGSDISFAATAFIDFGAGKQRPGR